MLTYVAIILTALLPGKLGGKKTTGIFLLTGANRSPQNHKAACARRRHGLTRSRMCEPTDQSLSAEGSVTLNPFDGPIPQIMVTV